MLKKNNDLVFYFLLFTLLYFRDSIISFWPQGQDQPSATQPQPLNDIMKNIVVIKNL